MDLKIRAKLAVRESTNAKMAVLKMKLKKVDAMMKVLKQMKKSTGWQNDDPFPIWFHLKIHELDPFLLDITNATTLSMSEIYTQYATRTHFLWNKFLKL